MLKVLSSQVGSSLGELMDISPPKAHKMEVQGSNPGNEHLPHPSNTINN